MSPSLAVVADNDLHTAVNPASAKPETVADKVRRLQAEARQLAKDHVRAFSDAMLNLEQMAAEIAEGGDAYAPGVRELARRFAEDCEARVQTLEAITART
jgi:hypothetical protein